MELFTIQIEDDFHLEKIASSGQCFRVGRLDGGIYRFITGGEVIYLKKTEENTYEIHCNKAAWENVWTDYFDLSRNYRNIRSRIRGKNRFIDQAAKAGAGLRVLRQDPWEMLVTFIISQRKNIPAISKAVEGLCVRYGDEFVTDYEHIHAFPTPGELCQAGEEGLRSCGLGYRAAYVQDAAQKVANGELNLSALTALGDEELFTELMKVHGVGKKVANCVCLFGYGRTSRVPVDVWIARAIEEECQGCDPFGDFGADAGIVQQYVFYSKRPK